LDIERGVKVAGSRSYYTKRELVLLEFALAQYAMEFLTKEKFVPMITPVLLNRKVMEGAGYIPQGEDEIYKTQDGTFLAGTSEQALAGYHMDDILLESALPLRYAGFSSCFRREAGSYGQDVRGVLRVHQFDKVEMFSYSKPEDSVKEHEFLISLEEKFMQSLEIPYQVINICAGDLGAPAAKKFDIEAWIPSEGKYRETHSCSNCTDFQARRLNIRYKAKDGKIEYLHTLNGTAFAVPRLLIAIMENFQEKDGSITIPEVLHKYLPFKSIQASKHSSE
jgi:seryl-tRNA synthetase